MKSTLKFISGAMLGLIMLISCSDNPVLDDEDKTDNIFPLKGYIGSYWKFERKTLDSNSNINTEMPAVVDSTFIAGTEPKLNRQAYIYRYRRVQGQGTALPDQYFYTENGKIYAHSDIVVNFTGFDALPISIPLSFDEQWFLYIDPDSDSWSIAQKNFNNDTLEIPGQATLVFNGSLELNGKRNGKETINIAGKNHKAHKFTLTMIFDINVTVIINNIPILDKIKFTREIQYWFVNNIGNVRQKLYTVSYKVPLVGNQTFFGYDATVIDYKLNKQE